MNDGTQELSQADNDLQKACSYLDVELAAKAIAAGANVNMVDEGGKPIVFECLLSDNFIYQFESDDDDDDDDLSQEEYAAIIDESIRRRIKIIEMMLSKGLNFKVKDGGGYPLMWHAAHLEPPLVEFLLRSGADANACRDDGSGFNEMPLVHVWNDEACCRGDEELERANAQINRLLLSYGALPYSPDSLSNTAINPNEVRNFEDVPSLVCPCAQNEENDVSQIDASLLEDCKNLDVAAVRKTIELGANPNVLVSKLDGGTPLLEAIIAISDKGHGEADARERGLQIVSLLLDSGADPNVPHCEHVDCSVYGGMWIGTTPLQHAAWLSKDVELSKMLLEHGANPNFLSSSIGGETIMDLNDLDCRSNEPEFDESRFAKPIEMLLASYGGCRRQIFDEDSVKGLSDEDAALVYACQRMDYGAVQQAVKFGGNLGLRQWGTRILPEVTLYDAPQVRGNWFRKNGWQVEQGVLDFILFLLVGMKFPLSEHDIDDILTACVYNGYEEVLKVLLEHHVLGALFRSRGSIMKRDTFSWTCWKREKRRRMAKLLALGGNQRSCTDE